MYTLSQLVQCSSNVAVDFSSKSQLRISEITPRPAISIQIKKTSLAELHGDVQEVFIFFIVEVTDDIGMKVALLKQLDLLLRKSKVLRQHAFDSDITVLVLIVRIN